jgi:hypothetical protein
MIAAVMCCCMVALGCTPAQKQTTLEVITAINAKMPEITAAADTVAATVAALAPSEAALIAVGDVAFDTASKTLQALTASYLANPSATVLAQIQAAINTLESNINTATLNAVGIKNTVNQQLAIAALKGLLTVVTIAFGLISSTESVTQLQQLRETDTIHLAEMRQRKLFDENKLRDEAVAQGSPRFMASFEVDRAFDGATAQGF